LDVQVMQQQNLNIDTDWMLHPTWECSCLQSFPTLKDFVRQINSNILRSSSLRRKIECIFR
jgi:hypothetical protein